MAKAYLIIQDTLVLTYNQYLEDFIVHSGTCIGYTYELEVIKWFIEYNPTVMVDIESSFIEIEYDNIIEFTRLLSNDYGIDDKIDDYLLTMHVDKFGNRAPLYEQASGELRPWHNLLDRINQNMFDLCTQITLLATKFMRNNNMRRTIPNIFLGNAEKLHFSRLDMKTLYIQMILNDNDRAIDYYIFETVNGGK